MHFYRVRRFATSNNLGPLLVSVKIGKLVTETFEIIRKSFGDEAMSKFKTFERYERFIGGGSSGGEAINDHSRAD